MSKTRREDVSGKEKREAVRPYSKPAIIYSTKMEARAVQCAKVTDTCGPGGPLTS